MPRWRHSVWEMCGLHNHAFRFDPLFIKGM